MWSAYVFICLMCFKPHMGRPQSDLENLGDQISGNVQQGLAQLDNLGTEIKAKVDNALLPGYAAIIRGDMANGVGGTTLATYDGKTPRTFIINNGTRSVCKGTLNGLVCDGTVEPFSITVNEDYCYATSYASVNNDICLSSRSVTLTFRNGSFVCTSGDGTPTLVLTKQEFQDLCSDVTLRRIAYKYYTNSTDPKAIAIPNSNPYVKCLNNEPGVCAFQEDKGIPVGSTNSKGKTDPIPNDSISTISTYKSGCNALFQRMEVILFAVTIGFLFQYK